MSTASAENDNWFSFFHEVLDSLREREKDFMNTLPTADNEIWRVLLQDHMASWVI